MKIFLFLCFTVICIASCHKERTTQEIMQDMLTSHKWELDSIYTTENGVFRVDSYGPGTEQVEFSKSTYSVHTNTTGPANPPVINYRYDAVNSRIYFWSQDAQENKDVYHNVENLSPSRLTLYDMVDDLQGGTNEYVYFYQAE